MLFKKLLVLGVIACGFSVVINSQENYNLELLSNVQVGHEGNDIWGYVDEEGTEYAVMGADTATYVFDLSDPSNPVQIAHIVGDRSIWRDFKSYGQFIYGIAYRGNDGFLIIDMSNAPENITYEYYAPKIIHTIDGDTIVNATFTSAHNIFIDEEGYIYFSDCPGFHRGISVFKIGEDPWKPEFVSIFNQNLSHDIYVRDGIAYSSDIFADGFSIWDVQDRENPLQIGFKKTTREFTHNAWLSDDGNYLFTTDELGAAWIESYDVSDPSDVKLLDRIRVTGADVRNVYPHNTHYHDGFLVTSYYVDGLVVFDASRPDNLVEVARYDTYLGTASGYHGCWGAYPFLPSGTLIASDIESGLFVFKPLYTRAAYLEGVVSDLQTGEPIQDVTVTILDEVTENLQTAFNGEFKTGRASAGSYTVEFYHPLYEKLSIEIELTNGEVNEQTIQLTPLRSIMMSGQVTDEETGSPVPNSTILFKDQELVLETTTDDNGFYMIDGYEGNYQIIAGAWGYHTLEIQGEIIEDNYVRDITLQAGYADEFVLDLGWEVINQNVAAGAWVRDVPYPTYDAGRLSNPEADIPNDIGDACYVTGNTFGVSDVGLNDLDDGTTILRSPEIILSGFNSPVLQNYLWFYASERTDREQLRNDTLFVQLIQGDILINLDTIIDNTDGWVQKEYAINQANLNLDLPIRFQYLVSDYPGPQQGNLVEAGLDGFAITEGFSVYTQEYSTPLEFQVTPNPFNNHIQIYITDEGHNLQTSEFILVDALGKEVLRTELIHSTRIQLGSLPSGLYLGFVIRDGLTSKGMKLIKTQ